MRFYADGPSIPGELLAARDEGQVIFFCGSGVSRAQSGLPDFYGLARAVIEELRASSTSRARAVVEASQRVGHIDGVGGLVPADRVFSLLEQEFSVEEVRVAVAKALRPTVDDLSAHRTLLDLARGTDSLVRLVTTNFDPLFEACDSGLLSHGPPDLPDPARTNRFAGIVHMHGRVGPDYTAPLDEEFVLSSADFGRAYLADGWATRFIRSLLDRYQLVFVGYAADDPPVQYLLEALGKPEFARNRIYAFQAGDDDGARALWAHKGVHAIAYDAAQDHKALWATLDAWAERARSPEMWQTKLLDAAREGPVDLQPHVRGQVAHIASLTGGAKQISRLGSTFPAEWLCVFDQHARYGNPGPNSFEAESEIVDPFGIWGLDSDLPPPAYSPDEWSRAQRKTPESAWGAFNLTRRDRSELDPAAVPRFYGGSEAQVSHLPPRLRHLGDWIVQIASDPSTLWWAVGKSGLHPHISGRIMRELEGKPDETSPQVREAWRILLSQSESLPSEHSSFEFYRLQETIKLEGWSGSRVRELAELRRPRRRVHRAYGVRRPPKAHQEAASVFRVEIEYPDAEVLREVPNEFLSQYARQLAAVVDEASALEEETHPGYLSLGPFTRTEVPDENVVGVGDDLTALFLTLLSVLERLAQTNPMVVMEHISSWASRTEPTFIRARIWASGKPALLSAEEASEVLAGLDNHSFWDRDHQRDLLHVLAERWSTFPNKARSEIGARLRAGPDSYDDESVERHAERAAWYSLERIQWLSDQGCQFEFDVASEISRLRTIQTRWTPDEAREADRSTEVQVHDVTLDQDPGELLQVPLAQLLMRASELRGGRIDHFVERRPFGGLVEQRPARALAALRRADPIEVGWAWATFLESEARKEDRRRLSAAIGAALVRLDASGLAEIARSATRWFEGAYDRIEQHDVNLLANLWAAFITAIKEAPEKAGSGVLVSSSGHDWVMEAINSPAGRLAELAVFKSTPVNDDAVLADEWLVRLSSLLALPGDIGLHALVLAATHVNYLYSRAKSWTETNLLGARHRSEDSHIAFWSGVFRARGLLPTLHHDLRDELLALAAERRSGRGWNSPLAAFLLWGWGRDDLREAGFAIDDAMMREALLNGTEDLKLQVLRTAQVWMQAPGDGWGTRPLELIGQVWPRQRVARSQAVSNALIRFILAGGAHFPQLVGAGVDLIEPVGHDAMWKVSMTPAEELARLHPNALLDFLIAMLPEKADSWPYQSDKVIETIGDGEFAHDPRLQELRRRLAAR